MSTSLPCPPALWPEFSALLDRALELPPAARRVWLDAAVGPRAPVRPYLERVLASAEQLEDTAYERGPALQPVDENPHKAGMLVGPYRLLRELGHGGMGEVWLAERADGAFRRRVALKLPHAHLLAGAIRQRFERERDFLAGLAHPHIAQFHDAGVSDAGLPWLAMEFVEGRPITAHCDRLRLGVTARVRLFLQVLEAVRHAHERFIAHRDIKPSNVLVDARGHAKLLDFGIAKLLQGDLATESTELTHLAGRAATPGYAAPEQVAGGPITTQVDVYALGAVLFTLLTGRRPPAPDEDGAAPIASRCIEREHAGAVGGVGPARLAITLRGDLDAILAKALQAEPAQRYRSVGAFADDLVAWAAGRPISARREGQLRRMWKLVRRHGATSALVAALVLALVGGSAGVAWEAVQARMAAQRADDEARSARATREFLAGGLEFGAAGRASGAITARELLDLDARRLEHDTRLDPDARIAMLGLLADLYDELDEPARFDTALAARTELALAQHGELHPVTLDARLRRVQFRADRGDHAGAAAALDELDGAIARAGLDGDAVRAYWWFLRGRTLGAEPGRDPDRAAAFERATALYERAAPQDARYPVALEELATASAAIGEAGPAAAIGRRAVDVALAQAGRGDGSQVIAWSDLGRSLAAQGNHDGAERAHDRAAKLALATYGADSWVYWHTAAVLAQDIHQRGDRARALAAWEPLMTLVPAPSARPRDALEDGVAAGVRELHGACLLAEGRAADALRELRVAQAGFARSPAHADELARVRGEIGRALAALGRTEEARTELASALAAVAATFPPDDPRVFEQRVAWARFLLRTGADGQAEAEFGDIVARAQGRRLETVALAQAGLAEVAAHHGDGPRALDASAAALEVFAHVTGPRDVRTLPQLELARAAALRAAGDVAGARMLAREALTEARRFDAPGSELVAAAQKASQRP